MTSKVTKSSPLSSTLNSPTSSSSKVGKSTLDATRVLLVGVGNMGAALAKGLTESRKHNFKVRAFDVHNSRLKELSTKFKIEVLDEIPTGSLDDDVVILAVKPQDLNSVGLIFKDLLPETTLLISILAGVTMDDIAKSFNYQGPIVRAMPNIAGTAHAAASAMCCNQECTETHQQIAEFIFNAIGEADWTKEHLMDAVTGLSGSGPAYVYMVIEALTDGGVKMGIPRQLAARLATQTVLGAALLVKESGLHPAVLKDQVTTPGGTTITAIHELEDRGLRAMLISAVETATKRAAFLRQKNP